MTSNKISWITSWLFFLKLIRRWRGVCLAPASILIKVMTWQEYNLSGLVLDSAGFVIKFPETAMTGWFMQLLEGSLKSQFDHLTSWWSILKGKLLKDLIYEDALIIT